MGKIVNVIGVLICMLLNHLVTLNLNVNCEFVECGVDKWLL